ncbi:MAG TPA: GTPase ObgE [Syntrophomonadaceae bacterium]|nr:GTPase ObgE [Syntrophomonadaceae bacterium]
MFVDQAKILVKGGDGGNGIIAFRREKYVPLGGPAGGDGGRGGSVILRADEGLRTLMDFRYKRHFKALRGAHGGGKNMHGASSEDLIVKVPPGTLVKDLESGDVIADLTVHGQEAIVAKGGRGGRGNARFAHSNNKAPTMAENGEPGEECWIVLELKVLADVGLVGFPNAGKSTIISRISAARPKIADYPFTTLVPNLGVVQTKNHDFFVVADIPGLIEGAHTGAGLGHDFLRHIERTRVLLFVLDAAQTEGRDVLDDYETLHRELNLHDPRLASRPYLVVANKMDLSEAQANLERLQERFGDRVISISAATGQGTEQLIEKSYQLLMSAPPEPAQIEAPIVRRFVEEEPFTIQVQNGVYEVSGKRIEKLLSMTNFSTDEGLQRFQSTIAHMGLEEALKKQGIKPGETVRISDMEFDYSE